MNTSSRGTFVRIPNTKCPCPRAHYWSFLQVSLQMCASFTSSNKCGLNYITCSLISHNPKEATMTQTFRIMWSFCCWPPPLSSLQCCGHNWTFCSSHTEASPVWFFIYFQDISFVSLQKNQLLVIFYAYLSLHLITIHDHYSTLSCFPLCYWSPPPQLVTIFFWCHISFSILITHTNTHTFIYRINVHMHAYAHIFVCMYLNLDSTYKTKHACLFWICLLSLIEHSPALPSAK